MLIRNFCKINKLYKTLFDRNDIESFEIFEFYETDIENLNVMPDNLSIEIVIYGLVNI